MCEGGKFPTPCLINFQLLGKYLKFYKFVSDTIEIQNIFKLDIKRLENKG